MSVLVNGDESVWFACGQTSLGQTCPHYPAEAIGDISVHNFHTILCFPLGFFNSNPVIFGNGFVFPQSQVGLPREQYLGNNFLSHSHLKSQQQTFVMAVTQGQVRLFVQETWSCSVSHLLILKRGKYVPLFQIRYFVFWTFRSNSWN